MLHQMAKLLQLHHMALLLLHHMALLLLHQMALLLHHQMAPLLRLLYGIVEQLPQRSPTTRRHLAASSGDISHPTSLAFGKAGLHQASFRTKADAANKLGGASMLGGRATKHIRMSRIGSTSGRDRAGCAHIMIRVRRVCAVDRL